MSSVVLQTDLGIGIKTQGKVRDLYDLGARMLIVGTDRISAFDWILPSGIPDKGRVLTQMSRFWFETLGCNDQVISYDPAAAGITDPNTIELLRGRCVLVHKAAVFPVECVVRGYLAGSGWKEYRASGAVCGVSLPKGLLESSRLPEPIFTPATKAAHGHDVNITFEEASEAIGRSVAEQLRERSLDIYKRASEFAATRGILIADTKFEWGRLGDKVILVDEALTPDSSRFWDAARYAAGRSQDPYDKQLVRDWLEASGWDKNSPPPSLPEAIVARTREKYLEAFSRLTGRSLGEEAVR